MRESEVYQRLGGIVVNGGHMSLALARIVARALGVPVERDKPAIPQKWWANWEGPMRGPDACGVPFAVYGQGTLEGWSIWVDVPMSQVVPAEQATERDRACERGRQLLSAMTTAYNRSRWRIGSPPVAGSGYAFSSHPSNSRISARPAPEVFTPTCPR